MLVDAVRTVHGAALERSATVRIERAHPRCLLTVLSHAVDEAISAYLTETTDRWSRYNDRYDSRYVTDSRYSSNPCA